MKRKVALLANGWNGENLDEFIVGFNEYFANAEVDLFVFTSYMLTDQSLAMRNAEDSIYDLPDYSIFDAAIVFGTGMHSELLADLTQKCQEADVPVIIQGNDIPGISSVTIDNIIGMKELCDHLIEEHNVSNVVYIAGDKDNPDSNCRMQALRESLEAHGHRLNKEDIIYANWNDRLIFNYIDEIYREGKKKLPDAFVCANDQMALSTLSFLKQMGIKLPEKVIVTGFDNLSAGRVFIPSLTTVDQCFKEQGMECAKFIDEASDNKKLVKKIILPSVVVTAESCGCIGCGNETALREDIVCNHWSNRFIVESLQAREDELSSCILSNEKFEDIHKNMNEKFLVTVGQETEDFHIYVNPQYKKLEYANLPDDEIIGPYFEPVMEVIAARTNGVVYDIPTLDTKNLFLGYDETNGGKTYVFTSLITDNYVCGYMVMGYKKDSFENKPNVKFKGCLRTTFTRFQRIIWDYYQTIKIKEQADIFLLQTAEALASAVDAKDSYTNGHAERVAKYARYIAEIAGMSEEECDEIYLAGVLHDVGKIGINDSIINKKGKLTDDEFATIKQHPVFGYDILSNIHMSHALSMGARHHHERYDGKGYPDGLKGEGIPQIARIIAVADAYDAMTSKRSYRDVIPQMQVREELLKGMGTQFDPQYAKIMIHLLDKDEEYKMKEKQSEEVFGANLSYDFHEYKTKVSAGVRITDCPVTVKLQYMPLKEHGMPTLLFYDSADAIYHLIETDLSKEMEFMEFASIRIDGDISTEFVRKTESSITYLEAKQSTENEKKQATIQMVKQEDHLLVKINTEEVVNETIVALRDASRYVYFALTGANCLTDILEIDVDPKAIEDNYVPRIVDKISYIDVPAGDIANVQVDAWRSDHSEVLTVTEHLEMSFHTMSLPTSRRIFHCPIVCLFTSDDGTIDGPNYREIMLARLDGEVWSDLEDSIIDFTATKDESFDNWNTWRSKNKYGTDCTISICFDGDNVRLQAENGGVLTSGQTTLVKKEKQIYCYLTGDQCAITDICIKNV